VVAAGSGVATRTVPPGAVLMGFPAVTKEKWLEQAHYSHRLKKLYAEVAELKARLAASKESG